MVQSHMVQVWYNLIIVSCSRFLAAVTLYPHDMNDKFLLVKRSILVFHQYLCNKSIVQWLSCQT